MLDGGCDPRYIARRLVRMASEDIGNADPRTLRLALDAWECYERLGSPKGELALAQHESGSAHQAIAHDGIPSASGGSPSLMSNAQSASAESRVMTAMAILLSGGRYAVILSSPAM